MTSYAFPADSGFTLPSLVDPCLHRPGSWASLYRVTQLLINARLSFSRDKAAAGSDVGVTGAVEILLLVSAHWGALFWGGEAGRQKAVHWRCLWRWQHWGPFRSWPWAFSFPSLVFCRATRSGPLQWRHGRCLLTPTNLWLKSHGLFLLQLILTCSLKAFMLSFYLVLCQYCLPELRDFVLHWCSFFITNHSSRTIYQPFYQANQSSFWSPLHGKYLIVSACVSWTYFSWNGAALDRKNETGQSFSLFSQFYHSFACLFSSFSLPRSAFVSLKFAFH